MRIFKGSFAFDGEKLTLDLNHKIDPHNIHPLAQLRGYNGFSELPDCHKCELFIQCLIRTVKYEDFAKPECELSLGNPGDRYEPESQRLRMFLNILEDGPMTTVEIAKTYNNLIPTDKIEDKNVRYAMNDMVDHNAVERAGKTNKGFTIWKLK